jgi:hypothetical protein
VREGGERERSQGSARVGGRGEGRGWRLGEYFLRLVKER